MEIQSAFNAGVQGFQKATESANQAAENIVESTSLNNRDRIEASEDTATNTQELNSQPPADLSQSVVDLKVAEFQAKASSEVIQSADESLGTLLDVRV